MTHPEFESRVAEVLAEAKERSALARPGLSAPQLIASARDPRHLETLAEVLGRIATLEITREAQAERVTSACVALLSG